MTDFEIRPDLIRVYGGCRYVPVIYYNCNRCLPSTFKEKDGMVTIIGDNKCFYCGISFPQEIVDRRHRVGKILKRLEILV